jgi:hypothetical protein
MRTGWLALISETKDRQGGKGIDLQRITQKRTRSTSSFFPSRSNKISEAAYLLLPPRTLSPRAEMNNALSATC